MTCGMIGGNVDRLAGWLNDAAHPSISVILVDVRLPGSGLLGLDQSRVVQVAELHGHVVGADERRQLTHAVHGQRAALTAGWHELTSRHLVVAADC